MEEFDDQLPGRRFDDPWKQRQRNFTNTQKLQQKLQTANIQILERGLLSYGSSEERKNKNPNTYDTEYKGRGEIHRLDAMSRPVTDHQSPGLEHCLQCT